MGSITQGGCAAAPEIIPGRSSGGHSVQPGDPLSRDVRGGFEPATQSSRSATAGDLVKRTVSTTFSQGIVGSNGEVCPWRVKGYLKPPEPAETATIRDDSTLRVDFLHSTLWRCYLSELGLAGTKQCSPQHVETYQ